MLDAPVDPLSEWRAFCRALDIGVLVPEAYQAYRPAIEDGVAFFLENLSLDRAMELLADQAELPDSARVEERLVAIARRCPALHKLAQVLARDRRLPGGLRRLLQHLETMPSALDVEAARQLLEQELGSLDGLGIAVDEPPIAEASVAVIVPFVARPGVVADDAREGVCKVLKPGIETKLEEDLDLLQQIGALLDERCATYGLPQIEYQQTFVEVRTLLAREVLLDAEQAHMRSARQALGGLRAVVVPEVFAFSTPHLTAMERIYGTKVTDVPTASVKMRRRLANTIIEALIARPLWSTGEAAMFHGDPHAGNLLATADGRLAILDWSLVGRLREADQIGLTQILIGAMTIDSERIREAIAQLADGRTDYEALCHIVEGHVALLRQGAWPGLSWLTEMMDRAVSGARGLFAGDLILFRKALQTLDGVIADVDESCRADYVLALTLLRRLAHEAVWRPLLPPVYRNLSSHLSTLDLTHLLLSAPLIGSRQLLGLRSGERGDRAPAAPVAGKFCV